MKWKYFILLCLAVDAHIFNVTTQEPSHLRSSPCVDSAHMLLVPGVLTSESPTTRACLSRFHTEGVARISVRLLTEGRLLSSAARDLPPGDGGCIDIPVPQLPNADVDLAASVEYPASSCTWERHASLRIASSRLLLLQTERSRYRPGDTVRCRVLALKSDLTPGRAAIDEIWLEGPPSDSNEGLRVTQWRHTRTRLGLTQLQYRLDARAQPGRWTVRAQLEDGSQGSTEFWVGDYELPPFHLSVRHAPRVLRTSERLVWNVCVRYPWSEAAEGMLVIRLRGAGGRGSSVKTAVRLRAPRPCHRHAVAARRLALDGPTAPDVIIADFSFQEDGTRIWQNTTVISQVVDKRVTLEFLSKHRTVIAPGLPYKLKIKATRWDGKFASNERLRVCRSPTNKASDSVRGPMMLTQNPTISASSDTNCDDSVTDGRGVARVMFTTSSDEKFAFYRFEASLHNNTEITTEPLYLPVKRSGSSHAAFGPLSGDSLSPGSRVFAPMYLNLKNVMTAITVHFVVITRGGTIYRWGATSQCPIANSGRARSALRDTDCHYFNTSASHSDTYLRQPHLNSRTSDKPSNISDTNPNTSNTNALPRHSRSAHNYEALLDRHLLRIMLPIRLTHQMCPDSQLVAYFYYNGELVSASKHIEVEECFANKAHAAWLNHQTAPGSLATLQLSTQGPSLCALSALDVASKWLQPSIPTAKEKLMDMIKRLMSRNRNMTSYDATGDCFMSDDNPALAENSKDLTVALLAAAGLRWVNGDITPDRRCDVPAPAPLTSPDDIPIPRSDFAEAWLWRLVGISANGSVVVTARAPDSITKYEATALCIARNGIAVSQPAVLQVFQEFFIHADGPKRIRRGDSTIVKYRIFNYLYEPLAVQIQILADPHLEILSPITESACLPPRASIAHRAEIRARAVGNARISLRGIAEWDGRCGNNTLNSNRSRISDEVIIRVDVDHEGVPKQEHRSMLLCSKDNKDASASKVTWNWPGVDIVSGSESLSVWAAGDISGSLLADADELVPLPRGCGEQNMAQLATNLLALSRLDPQTSASVTARDHVMRGFTRQLQFAHPSGGFSAFGASDGTPSTWLTAFAIRYLRRAHQVLFPETSVPLAVERSERWLISQQMENGCFRNEGQVFHRELKGGLGEEGEIASVALTAYVITSLVEGSVTLPSRVLRNSLSCLRALPPLKTKATTRIYAHALLSYTFMRLKKYEDDLQKSNDATYLWRDEMVIGAGLHQDEEMKQLVQLLNLATRTRQFVFWETGSLSTSIEATSYALLALASCPVGLRETNCAQDARAAIRWLNTHRNAAGGFMSTQDTLVAMEALTAWSSVQPSTPADLNVTARCAGVSQTHKLNTDSGKVAIVMKMKSCDELKVSVEGTGCALVQATRSYNTMTAEAVDRNSDLSVQVAVHTEGPFDCDENSTFCFCAAVVEACVLWTGSFPEMALLEVSLPGGFGVESSLLYSQMQQPFTLLRRIEVTPNGGRVSMYLGTRDGSDVITGRAGHQCYNLHAVGPRARTKAAYAKVMDYYNPDVNDTQIYTIPEDCPPRILHETKPNVVSDNLYGSARSRADGELIITDIFFEDMVDGPLEDPLYDNLTDNGMKDAKENDDDKDNVTVETDNENGTNNNEDQNFGASEFSDSNTDTKQNTKEVIEEENEIANLATDNHEANKIPPHKIKENLKDTTAKTVDNPNLSHFHVIDSEKDLEVPEGIEGNVPSVVLPPQSFVPSSIPLESSFPPSSVNPKMSRRPTSNVYLFL